MKYLRFVIFTILFLTCPLPTGAEFIGNENTVPPIISRQEVTRIFLFYQKFWNKNGGKITVILPPPDSLLFKKLAAELSMSSVSYYENIRSKIKAGTANPIFADTELEILIKISNTPNSIGFYYDGLNFNNGFGIDVIQIY